MPPARTTDTIQTAALLAQEELDAMDDVQLVRIATRMFQRGSWQRRAIEDRTVCPGLAITVEERTCIPGPDGLTMWPVAIIKVSRPATPGTPANLSRSVLYSDTDSKGDSRWKML